MFEGIERVIFETSNLCAMRHARCPASLVREPSHLPARIVVHVVDALVEEGWWGKVAFHNYNEPLMDPRLGLFISCAQANGWPVQMWSNGQGTSQALVDELVAMGVTEWSISLYSQREKDRLGALNWRVKAELHPSENLDDRLDWYQRPKLRSSGVCQWPARNLLIRHDGNMALCCFDWRGNHNLGNLKELALREIMEYRRRVVDNLEKGIMRMDLCKRCSYVGIHSPNVDPVLTHS